MDKVAVFLDYENVHRTGHHLFARVGEPLYETAVNPLHVARRLVAKRKHGGVLSSVKVFRGRPVPARQPRPASANDVQTSAWESDTRVTVFRRDLKYDVAIVFSGDTDLAPALELVFRRGLVHLEIAAWMGSKPLWFPEFMRQTAPVRLPYCHFLDKADFVRVRDFSDVR